MAKHLLLWPVYALREKGQDLLLSFSYSAESVTHPKLGRTPLAACFVILSDPLFFTGFDEKRLVQVKTK